MSYTFFINDYFEMFRVPIINHTTNAVWPKMGLVGPAIYINMTSCAKLSLITNTNTYIPTNFRKILGVI